MICVKTIKSIVSNKKSVVLSILFLMINPIWGEPLSFHTVFPATWYEKCLNSTIFVWNQMGALLEQEQHDTIPLEIFDLIVGRCAVACFCLEKMSQQGQLVAHEDMCYLDHILHMLEQKVMTVRSNSITKDRCACLVHIIMIMKRLLQVPSDI